MLNKLLMTWFICLIPGVVFAVLILPKEYMIPLTGVWAIVGFVLILYMIWFD